MKTAIAILCLGAAAARDLDGDGVEDAAAEGDCCAAFYGADLADCGGATPAVGEVRSGGLHVARRPALRWPEPHLRSACGDGIPLKRARP